MTEYILFKEKYDVACCMCGHEFKAAPSMMMTEFGRNSGHGRCSQCKTFLHLEIDPDLSGAVMISKDHREWVNENQK